MVENKRELQIFKTTEVQRRSQAVVVDEAHFVIDWKDFRPSYGKLGILRSIFPKVPLLGMTATVTKRPGRDIIESLGVFNPAEVIGNPDRPNIYFSASTRPDRGEDKYRTILEPLCQSLKLEREKFPFTIIFGKLETISSCYSFFSHSMGNDKYAPKGTLHKAEKRLFTQFHEQYPLKEKERIVDGLIKGTSNLRLVFATVAFGVGLDLDFIRQVIHIGVPYTMEEYYFSRRQEELGGMDYPQRPMHSTMHMMFQKQENNCLLL